MKRIVFVYISCTTGIVLFKKKQNTSNKILKCLDEKTAVL